MSSTSLWQRIPLALKILVLGSAAVAALVLLKPTPEPRPAAEQPKPRVEVVYAQPQTQTLDVHTQGTIAPRRQIDLISQVSGPVVAVAPSFVNGGFFSAGDVLLQVDAREYEYALTRAQARVAEAERVLASERGAARQAEREWRDLGDADANALFLRKPQLAAADSQLAAAIAERNQASLQLERTQVRAPFDGRVHTTYANLGQHLTPGIRLATIYDASVAEVRLPLTDQQAQLIDLPLVDAPVSVDARPSVTLRGQVAGQTHEWQGELVRTEASLDTRSRMYYALVEIPQPFDNQRWSAPLLIGLYVEARIQGRPLDQLVSLPKSCIFKRNQVYTLDAEQRVRAKTLEVLHSDEHQVWVRGDLAPNEPVVLNRQGYLNPGVLVEVVPQSPVDAHP